MNLIDLAFINKFANSQSSEENSHSSEENSSNIIYKKQNGPRKVSSQPAVNGSFEYNNLLYVTRIMCTKDIDDDFNPSNYIYTDSEISFSGSLRLNSVPAGCYIIFAEEKLKEVTPYICGIVSDPYEDYYYMYTSVTLWDGQLDKWEGYSTDFYGFTMPDLESSNNVLMFYVHDAK